MTGPRFPATGDWARRTRCILVQLVTPSPVFGSVDRRHTARCLSCQAEVRRERQVVRLLHEIAREVHPAPPDLPARVAARTGTFERLDGEDRSVRGGRGLVAASAASLAAAGLAIAASRRLRSAPT